MPTAQLRVSHALSMDELRARLESMIARDAVGNTSLEHVDFNFADDVFVFSGVVKGFHVSGTVAACADCLQGEMTFPWALKPFQGKAIEKIEAYFARHLQ